MLSSLYEDSHSLFKWFDMLFLNHLLPFFYYTTHIVLNKFDPMYMTFYLHVQHFPQTTHRPIIFNTNFNLRPLLLVWI